MKGIRKLRDKSKARLDALLGPKRTPSSSPAPSARGSTVSLADPAVPQPSEEAVNTGATHTAPPPPSATETSASHGSTRLAPEPTTLAPHIADTLETPDSVEAIISVGQPGTQEPSGDGKYILPSEIARAKLQAIELTTDKIATPPIDAVLLLRSTPKNTPTTPLDQPPPQLEETECLSNVAGDECSPGTGNKLPLLPIQGKPAVHVPTTSTSNTGGTSQITSEQQPQTANTLSLWEEAWKKLPEDVRTHFQATLKLGETDSKGSGAARQLLTTIAEIRGICEKQKLIDTRDDGKKSKRIIVRDLVDKLTSCISKFVAVGDTLVQYDPGHAAIPWAILRFILQSAIIHQERMAEIVTNTEYLGRLIVRCVAYEELYLVPKSKPTNYSKLKFAVEELYRVVLEFLVETAKHLDRKTLGRVFKAILEPESLSELLGRIKSHEQQLGKELELAQRQAAQTSLAVAKTSFAVAEHNHKQLMQLLDDLEKPIQRVASDLQACYQSVQAQTRQGVLNWITNTEYQAPHNLALQGLLEDTGKWFFDRAEYKEWRSASASSLLWLHGIPGAGKTKLTCQVIKTLLSTNPNEVLCYFYCKRDGEASRRIPLTVLQAILRQLSLCHPDKLPTEIFNRYTADQQKGFPAGKSGVLQWEECRALLLSLLNIYPQTTIIIDALDELDSENESEHRILLLELLIDVVLKCDSLVKIFVASRDDQDIVVELEKMPNLFIKATDNLKDIERYIVREFETNKRFSRPPWSHELKNFVYAELCKKAGGMFQWVKLQLQFLVSMKVERDIRQKLGQAPKDLTAAYDQIYTLIEGEEEYGRETAKCALMWIMCTVKPLTMEMLLEVTRYATGSQDISAESLLELCRNLLTWDKSEKSNVVQFAHLSVKEYLIAGKWTEAEAHGMAANSCLTIVIKEHEHGSQLARGQVTTFLEYADSYWLEHVSKGCASPSCKTFKEALCSFLGSPVLPSPSYRNWIRGRQQGGVQIPEIEKKLYQAHHIGPPNPLFLVAACDFLLEVTDEFWQKWECFDLCSLNDSRDSLLHIAARCGHSAVVTRLLAYGMIDLNVGNGNEDTPLLSAASRGHTEIVQQLLAHSAINVNLQGKSCDRDTGTPLFVAACGGHAEVVQQLLVHSAIDVNLQGETCDGDTGTPLFVAACGGHAEVVQQLLVHSAIDVNLQGETCDGDTGTPLFGAAYEGHTEIVQQLLAHSARDVELPLLAAARCGHTEIVQKLLACGGIDVNVEGQVIGNTGTPLFAAALGGYAEIVQQLLAHSDINVNLQGKTYEDITGTPLFVAACEGHTEIVQQLLAHSSIDVNPQREKGDATPLFVAAYMGHTEIVQQLLAHSAIDVNLQGETWGGDTGSPLFVAALEGHTEIVQQLLAQSAVDANVKGKIGRDTGTALFVAALKGHAGMVQKLLAHSAIDVNAEGKTGSGNTGTPLFMAALKGHTEIVQQFLAHSAVGVNLQGETGNGNTGTPLFMEASWGRAEIVQELLAHSAIDVNAEGKTGSGNTGTPLFVAALKGRTEIVQQLLAHSGIDIHVKGGTGGGVIGTPLFVAALQGHTEIVQQLLAHNAIDVNVEGKTGSGDIGTPLFVAVSKGQREIVQQLLAHSGIDVNVKGGTGGGDTGTPFFMAALRGHTEIVQKLLTHSAIDVNAMWKTGDGDIGTPLFVAAIWGHAEVVQKLLAQSIIDVNVAGGTGNGDIGTPLFMAALKGCTEISQQLLDHSAIDVNVMWKTGDGDIGTPLFVAALKGRTKIVQQLLSHSAIDVNVKGGTCDGDTGTPLFVAAYKGHTEIVQQLLAHRTIDVNLEGETDYEATGTPLFVAAYKGHIEIVQQLLAHGAIDTNLRPTIMSQQQQTTALKVKPASADGTRVHSHQPGVTEVLVTQNRETRGP